MKVEIKITSNKSKKTFTIYKNGSKYRTNPVEKFDFEEMEYWTENDWKDYLKKSEDYYLVK